MWLLVLGVLLFCLLHLLRGLAPGLRDSIVTKFGEGPFKGIFSLSLIGSIILMVFGWRAVEPEAVYIEPDWALHVTLLLVLLAFILFAAANMKSNIKRFIRHPMLTGVVLWAIGHLLMNGDDRSLVLFAGIGIWAVLEILLINRREGAYEKPASIPLVRDLIPVAAGAVVFAIFLFVHPWLFGVSPLARF